MYDVDDIIGVGVVLYKSMNFFTYDCMNRIECLTNIGIHETSLLIQMLVCLFVHETNKTNAGLSLFPFASLVGLVRSKVIVESATFKVCT